MVPLKDNDEGKFFLWAAVQTVDLIVHFFVKGEMIRVTDLHSFLGSGLKDGQLVRDLERIRLDN